MNEKTKGGSFYLQSKVVRAKETLELQMQEGKEAAEKLAAEKKATDASSSSDAGKGADKKGE